MADKHPSTKEKRTVITTHVNADFDAMASMLGAQKLYPGSVVVFPGSQERNLRSFFVESMRYLYSMADIKEISFSEVERLVVVDTKQAHRIGKLAPLLEDPGIEIHLYDHHPPAENDIKGHLTVQESTGANITLLVEIIKQRGIDITPDEATIMSLGIYEDTGSFTFTSTTQRDYMAAAFLHSKGSNLSTIANLTDKEISPEHIGLLNDMIQAANHHRINGVDVVVTTVTTGDYVPDFATLVHKMVKMEGVNAVFTIARMSDKIYIVARSRIPEVDAGAILAPLGGGGHAYAAAASIKGKTLVQAEQELFESLHERIRSRQLARNLMSFPPITIEADATCREAGDKLIQYNVNALLVTETGAGTNRRHNGAGKGDVNGPGDAGGLLGLVTRQIIEKALYHKLGHVPVREYTNTELASVGPDAELVEIQNKIIEHKQRLLPVMDGDDIIGVVTRTDLLNVLVRQPGNASERATDPSKEPVYARTRDITKFIEERLSSRIIEIMKSIGRVAGETGCNAYVVGGFVRDLFLYRDNEDLDIVIEGDGIAFAKRYRKTVGARIHTHEKFGTAVVIFPDGFKVDVASARMEYYKFPAALPTVEMSSIKLDLYRRDFTINTLAIQLNPKRFGRLIDFFTAQNDIKEKTIRILHNLSFVEDPTRVFRAIRFEQRFGFTIGRLTAGLIENAVKMDFFKRLSGRRVFNELRLILEEENPIPALVRLNEYDMLKVVHPSIKLSTGLVELLEAMKKVLSWHDLLFVEEPYKKWTVYFLVLISRCDRKTSEGICKRLELAPRHEKLFCQERFEAERCLFWLEQHMPVSNNTLYERLSGFKTEPILYMMATTGQERIKRAISYYYTHLRYISITLTGKDLQNMGLEPGPVYRRIFQAVLDAKLNGQVATKSDELALASSYVK